MHLKFKNTTGEETTIAPKTCSHTIITGTSGPTTSLLDQLTMEESSNLHGWFAVALRKADRTDPAICAAVDKARRHGLTVQTIVQSLEQLKNTDHE